MIRSKKNGFFMIRSKKKQLFWWSVFKKTQFFHDPFSKNGFFHDPFAKKMFFQKRFLPGDFRKRFGKKQKFVQKIDPKIYLKKSGAKIQPKKARPKSQAKSYKKSIQISRQQPKNGAAREARTVFGRRALARRVVVLNFVSVFCRNLLEFLAEFLTKFFLGLDLLTFSFDIYSTFSSVKKKNKSDKKSLFWTKILAHIDDQREHNNENVNWLTDWPIAGTIRTDDICNP